MTKKVKRQTNVIAYNKCLLMRVEKIIPQKRGEVLKKTVVLF